MKSFADISVYEERFRLNDMAIAENNDETYDWESWIFIGPMDKQEIYTLTGKACVHWTRNEKVLTVCPCIKLVKEDMQLDQINAYTMALKPWDHEEIPYVIMLKTYGVVDKILETEDLRPVSKTIYKKIMHELGYKH